MFWKWVNVRNRLFIFILLVAPFTVFSRTVFIRSMQFKNLKNACAVIFNLSAPTQYRSFMLHHPSRYVLDLKNIRTPYPLHFTGCSDATVKQFRYATHPSHIFRMVFTLSGQQIPSVQVLKDNTRHQARLQVIFPKVKSSLRHKLATSKQPVLTDTAFNFNAQKHRDIIVVIDPGHGGKDPGATGIGGTKEKNIVLAISKFLQKDINAQPGFRAVLTRTGDYYLTLRQRLAIARKDNADMFIAIHADKWKNTTAHGVSIFALSQKGATSEAARWLAQRENASELMGGVHLNDKSHLLKSVLINLSQSATIRSSLFLGNDIMQQIKPIAHLHHDRVEQAAFVVLKSPDIPSLLIETGFLSNPEEETRLKSVSYEKKLALALTHGITTYFQLYPPRTTWLSYWRKNPAAPRRHGSNRSSGGSLSAV